MIKTEQEAITEPDKIKEEISRYIQELGAEERTRTSDEGETVGKEDK